MRLLFISLLLVLGTTTATAEKLDVYDTLGGDFSLRSTLGKEAGPQDFRGKVLLLFFGYLSCPDICPVSMATIRDALSQLPESEAAQVQPMFVSVDPERDRVDALREFVTYFHPNFVGFTGEHEKLRRIIRMYGGAYMKDTRTKTDSGYLVAHSGYVYLMDQKGQIRALYKTDTSADTMAEGIRTLLNES